MTEWGYERMAGRSVAQAIRVEMVEPATVATKLSLRTSTPHEAQSRRRSWAGRAELEAAAQQATLPGGGGGFLSRGLSVLTRASASRLLPSSPKRKTGTGAAAAAAGATMLPRAVVGGAAAAPVQHRTLGRGLLGFISCRILPGIWGDAHCTSGV